jgi:hypothetical protein
MVVATVTVVVTMTVMVVDTVVMMMVADIPMMVVIKFHPLFFLTKDQATKQTLFRGPCHGGLYPLIRDAGGRPPRQSWRTNPISNHLTTY